METENKALSTERSLEIITATIEANRRSTLNYLARPLVILGLYVIVCSLIGWYLYKEALSEYVVVSWFLLVVIGFVVEYCLERRRGVGFGSLLSHTVGSIWGVFCVFALFLAVFSLLLYLAESNPLAVMFFVGTIPVMLILLMTMAGMITGLVLKNYLIVYSGALGGLLSFLAYYFELDMSGMLIFAFTAFVELVVPGIILLFGSKKK